MNDKIETCTRCGGIGRVPNHPHIVAHRCSNCGGTGKVTVNIPEPMNKELEREIEVIGTI